jgi:hypothetical protein
MMRDDHALSDEQVRAPTCGDSSEREGHSGIALKLSMLILITRP